MQHNAVGVGRALLPNVPTEEPTCDFPSRTAQYERSQENWATAPQGFHPERTHVTLAPMPLARDGTWLSQGAGMCHLRGAQKEELWMQTEGNLRSVCSVLRTEKAIRQSLVLLEQAPADGDTGQQKVHTAQRAQSSHRGEGHAEGP